MISSFFKILQPDSLKHAAACSQKCELIHGIQIMFVHTTFCVKQDIIQNTKTFKARNVSYRNKEEWTYRMEEHTLHQAF
jgi:hypothetical protein